MEKHSIFLMRRPQHNRDVNSPHVNCSMQCDPDDNVLGATQIDYNIHLKEFLKKRN